MIWKPNFPIRSNLPCHFVALTWQSVTQSGTLSSLSFSTTDSLSLSCLIDMMQNNLTRPTTAHTLHCTVALVVNTEIWKDTNVEELDLLTEKSQEMVGFCRLSFLYPSLALNDCYPGAFKHQVLSPWESAVRLSFIIDHTISAWLWALVRIHSLTSLVKREYSMSANYWS